MKNLLFKLLACLLVVLGAGMVPSFAESTVMPDVVAAEKARYSYMMTGTDGKLYNLYIIGDNEQFIGVGNSTWYRTKYDQVYAGYPYRAYISRITGGVAEIQYNQLFGNLRNKAEGEPVNLSDPTYRGGVCLIKGVDGQPDMLMTAHQVGATFVDYRFFVIKNGELRPMKFLFKNGKTALAFDGHHVLPYELDDGTVAVPWFRRKTMEAKGGVFVTVFMPDYTNLVLIEAYTYDDK